MSIFRAWFAMESMRFRIRALKAFLRDQRAELLAIRRHLRPGDIACDIGAYKGRFIYWLSCWVRDGRVVAFEPQPDLARNLLKVSRVIGLGNVTVEAKAAYSQSGAQDLYVLAGHRPGASLMRGKMGAQNLTALSVPVVALDDYFDEKDKVALLKIDAEGAELEVLRGAERMLRSQSPLLVFECENRHQPGWRLVLEEEGLL